MAERHRTNSCKAASAMIGTERNLHTGSTSDDGNSMAIECDGGHAVSRSKQFWERMDDRRRIDCCKATSTTNETSLGVSERLRE